METPLRGSLNAGRSYCAKWYLSLGDSSRFASGNIGFYFSSDSVKVDSIYTQDLDKIPQVEAPASPLLDDSTWRRFSGTFTASGGERFLTIGNFHKAANTAFQDSATPPPWFLGNNDNLGWAYYYIDEVSVVPIEPVRLAGDGDTTICRGESVRLASVVDTTSRFRWTPAASLSSDSISNPVASPDTATTYSVSKRTCCDTTSAQVTVKVIQPPPVEAGTDRSLPQGESTTIGSEGADGVHYQWRPKKGLASPSSSSTKAAPKKDRRYILSAMDSAYGCKARDTVRIDVNEKDLFIPNVFAPSAKGDAENRKFRVYGGPFETYHLQVFSRWGELVFETKDPTRAWEGRYKGEPMQAGAYAWQFRGRLKSGEQVERSGTVTLLR